VNGAPAKPISGVSPGDELADRLRDEGDVLGGEVGDRRDVVEGPHR
jgi:hypothetical protein